MNAPQMSGAVRDLYESAEVEQAKRTRPVSKPLPGGRLHKPVFVIWMELAHAVIPIICWGVALFRLTIRHAFPPRSAGLQTASGRTAAQAGLRHLDGAGARGDSNYLLGRRFVSPHHSARLSAGFRRCRLDFRDRLFGPGLALLRHRWDMDALSHAKGDCSAAKSQAGSGRRILGDRNMVFDH